MNAAAGSLLAQSRPSGTTAATLFTATMPTEITSIVVCNTSAAAATFRICHDDDGTTYDQTTALYYDANINAGETMWLSGGFIGGGMHMAKDGTLGIRTNTASALTFSAYGITASLGGRYATQA